MGMIPEWAKPSCENRPALAFAYGAVSHLTGLDRLLPAPPAVHWAVAGTGADYQCRGSFNMDKELAMCMAGGFGGGYIATMFFP